MPLPMTNHNEHEETATAARLRRLLKVALADEDISRRKASELTGIAYSTLLDHLQGKGGGVTVDDAARLAALLNVPLAELVQVAESDIGYHLRTDMKLLPGSGGEDGEQGELPLFRSLTAVR